MVPTRRLMRLIGGASQLGDPLAPCVRAVVCAVVVLSLLPGSGAAGAGEAAAVRAVDRVFPVRGSADYGSAHHDYPATDIFAGCGQPVVAPVRGTVLEVSRRDRWDAETDRPKDRGGKFVSILGVDRVRYYGSHLRSLARGAHRGAHMSAGEMIGRVGRTGNARSTPCHLHFGLSPRCHEAGDWWIRRGVVSPYRYLRSWQGGGDRSPRHVVRAWRRDHGCQRSAVLGRGTT